MRRIIIIMAVLVVGGFLLIQLVPYGHNHTNPPVVQEPQWDSPQTRALAARACFDCHSNETAWPWYTNVAPASWLIQHDVEEGQRQLNFSEWNKLQREARNAGRVVQRGELPDPKYLPLHPDARLTDAEKQALIQGLNTSLR